MAGTQVVVIRHAIYRAQVLVFKENDLFPWSPGEEKWISRWQAFIGMWHVPFVKRWVRRLYTFPRQRRGDRLHCSIRTLCSRLSQAHFLSLVVFCVLTLIVALQPLCGSLNITHYAFAFFLLGMLVQARV